MAQKTTKNVKFPNKFNNSLNIPINAYYKLDKNKKVGVGKPSDPSDPATKLSRIEANDDIPFVGPKVPPNKDFYLILETVGIPKITNDEGEEIEGVKFFLGKYFIQKPHHVKTIRKSDGSYYVEVHFEGFPFGNRPIETHEDPDIEHPETGPGGG